MIRTMLAQEGKGNKLQKDASCIYSRNWYPITPKPTNIYF